MTVQVRLGADAEARKARPVTLDPTWPASEAFAVVATECTDHWRTNAALLLESRAMPHLHQTRVGIRRLRSSFSLFRPLLRDVPGAFLVAHRLRALALPFGPARDLDVLLSGPLVDDLDDEQVHRLAAGREAAYDVVHAILRSPDWADAVRSLDGLVLLAPWPGVDDPPVRELAAQALEKRWHRVVGHVDQLATMAPQDRHRVRIEAKKLRYGCEFFASLYAVDTPRVVTESGARAHRAARLRLARRAGADRPRAASTTTTPPTACCARSARPPRGSTSTGWSRTPSTRCARSPRSTRSGTEPPRVGVRPTTQPHRPDRPSRDVTRAHTAAPAGTPRRITKESDRAAAGTPPRRTYATRLRCGQPERPRHLPDLGVAGNLASPTSSSCSSPSRSSSSPCSCRSPTTRMTSDGHHREGGDTRRSPTAP